MIINCTVAFASEASNPSLPVTPVHAITYKQIHVCDRATVGFANCLAIVLKPTGIHANTTKGLPDGLAPKDLQHAYNLPSMTAGKGQTIAIIDSYDNPIAEKDFAVYRATFGLPPCTAANGCFRKVDQDGGKKYPQPDASWASEISLDLDMVSAIAPNSHILLVEANTANLSDLGRAVDTAARMGATEISNSYGSLETARDATTMAHYFNHPGVAITASSGDSGYGVQLPAAYNTVIAVGGTTLNTADNARGWTESAWGGSGSGCSRYISKPKWQSYSQCSHRAVVDVSAVADPDTGVAVYNSYQNSDGQWAVYGGTSASAPIIAGIYALAGNATRTSASYLYNHTANLNDVTNGTNGTCQPIYLCTASKGYDGPTGLGTPYGIGAF
ncbi:MAG: S53 family peptidase [Ktedonobacteraceae bacterium]|nr:S53 family peptidase [Ktedonobacteraceae bacterium]